MKVVDYLHRFLGYPFLKKKKIYIQHGALLRNCVFDNTMECYNAIGAKCFLDSCNIGIGTYLGDSCKFKKTSIGKYCSIASNVQIVYGEHPVKKYVSLHPAFYLSKNIAGLSFKHKSTFVEYKYTVNGFFCEIGNDVWIGSNVTILGGHSIGDGAVIAAGAVVTKDVAPYTIVAGNPAKEIRKRFDENQIEKLIKLKWWDKEHKWIETNIELFDDVGVFLKKCNDEY